MGIMDIFRPTQQTRPVQQQGPMEGRSMQQQSNPMEEPAKPQGSPLDNFSELLKNDDTGDGTSPDPFSQPLFGADPSKITEAASKADFLSSLPRDLVEKAMSGQDPQAFMEVINKTNQQSLALALQLTTALMEQAGGKMGARFKEALPTALKDTQVRSMKSENPILQHPTSEPMLMMLRERIQRNEPNLSPQEINAKAEEYLTTWAKELTGSTAAPEPKKPGQDTDWEEWLK